MRQFYRVYEYDKASDITTNPVFFHDRENAIAHFDQLAWRADALAVDKVINENNGWISAYGFERHVFFEVLNFED
jgi:hypothetical protein